MLGIPDGIRGCLFDLDGVLTRTAEVHDAGFVAGVDRLGQAAGLRRHGADVVVADLAELLGNS